MWVCSTVQKTLLRLMCSTLYMYTCDICVLTLGPMHVEHWSLLLYTYYTGLSLVHSMTQYMNTADTRIEPRSILRYVPIKVGEIIMPNISWILSFDVLVGWSCKQSLYDLQSFQHWIFLLILIISEIKINEHMHIFLADSSWGAQDRGSGGGTQGVRV